MFLNHFCLYIIKMGNSRVLIVILSETRAQRLTFDRFKKNVLDVLDSDLAVCIGKKPHEDLTNDLFVKNSKYVFLYEETSDDFQGAFESLRLDNGKPFCESLRKIQNQLFGGVVCSGHPGSAGILLFMRSFLAKKLQTEVDMSQYGYVMVTRSDYYYELPHPQPMPGRIMVPEGEDYGGLTDRHMVCPTSDIISALTILDPILIDGDAMVKRMAFNDRWNLETFIMFMFEERGLMKKVVRFPRIMYAVRENGGSTRWSKGAYNDTVGMIVKYPSEFEMVKNVLFENGKSLENFQEEDSSPKYIYAYQQIIISLLFLSFIGFLVLLFFFKIKNIKR